MISYRRFVIPVIISILILSTSYIFSHGYKTKKFNHAHIDDIIQKEKQELSDIFEAIRQKETLAENVNDTYDEESSFAQRVADKMADFGGSWSFILTFLGVLLMDDSKCYLSK